MIRKTIALTSSRQITLPSALIKMIGAKPGSRLTISYDAKNDAIILARQKSIDEALNVIDRMNEEALRKRPQLADNIRKISGKEFEEVRNEWYSTEDGRKYYEEKYGVKG